MCLANRFFQVGGEMGVVPICFEGTGFCVCVCVVGPLKNDTHTELNLSLVVPVGQIPGGCLCFSFLRGGELLRSGQTRQKEAGIFLPMEITGLLP